MKKLIKISAVTILLAGSAYAFAQAGGYSGPSSAATAASAGYAGPSSVPLMTARDLLAKGKDDQYVKLKGKITVEIDAKRFPAGVKIDHNTLVELTGEFDKETFGESTLDVKQIVIVP